MGQVYRATDSKLKRQVAIKILPPSLAADADRLARFQREAEVLASLNHPHIAAIYGLEESAGATALVMELVEGDDLSQRIARGPIPLDEALPIAKQIAEALMRKAVTAPLLVSSVLALALGQSPRRGEIVFQDDFKAKLGEGWQWIREDPAAWRIGKDGLEIRVQPGNMWGGANDAKNVLVRAIPEPATGTIEVSVTVTNRPSGQYEQIDLVWYYDDRHMVKIGQEQVDGVLSLVMGREEADKTRTIAIIPIEALSLDVRFLVSGDQIRGQFRPSGDDVWRDAGQTTLPASGDAKASLQVYQGPPGVERWARFNAFRLSRQIPLL